MKKKTYLHASLIFLAVNLVAYASFHIPYYVFESDIGEYEYFRIFLTKLCEFALPPIGATLIYLLEENKGTKNALVGAIYLALPRAIYLLPYYYLYYIAYGYDSIESILLSLLVTIFGVVIMWGQILLLHLVLCIGVKISSRKKADLSDSVGIFNLGEPVTAGIFATVFAQFIIGLLSEIVHTVDYLISYAGYYRTDEIIYITICYIFLIVELMLVHAIACYLRKKTAAMTEANND